MQSQLCGFDAQKEFWRRSAGSQSGKLSRNQKRVDIYKNLEYPSSDKRNKYDIYLPKDVQEELPTIVWVLGGAFVAGSKDGIENYAVMLADEGYAVVGVDYQWAPEIKYPGQVRQVEECLQHLKTVQWQYH